MSSLFLPHVWSPWGWLVYDCLSACAAAALARALLPRSPAAAPMLAGAGLFLFLRSLPQPSVAALEAAEADVLSMVAAPIEHHWTPLTTSGGVEWNVHSICVRAPPPPPAGGAAAAQAADPRRRRAPLVLLHGHSTGCAHWEVLLRLVAPHTDVWILDLPGWGRTAAPPQLLAAPRGASSATATVDLLVGMLEGWLRAHGLYGGTALLGHSMGGHLAASFAVAHPGALSQLLLASPVGLLPMTPGWVSWRATAVFYMAPPQRVVRVFGRLAGAFFNALLRFVYPEDNPRFPAYYYQLAWNTRRTGAADAVFSAMFQLRSVGRALWSRPVLPALTLGAAAALPLALLWGTEEEMMNPAQAALLHRLRPRTDVYLIKGGKHNSAHSHPELFCAAVVDALEKAAAAGGGGAGARAAALDRLRPVLDASVPHGALESAARDGTADALVTEGSWAVALRPRVPGGAGGGVAAAAARAAAGGEGAGALPEPPAPAAAAATVGYCAGCGQRVGFHKSYWHCGCGAWSFTSNAWDPGSWGEAAAQIRFCDELYLAHPAPFNARTSAYITQTFKASRGGGDGAPPLKPRPQPWHPAVLPGLSPAPLPAGSRGSVFLLSGGEK